MEVVVIGAGAVGMLVASFLSKENNVTLVVRRQEQAVILNQLGLHRINIDETIKQSTIKGTTTPPQTKDHPMVIIAVKYGQLQSIYPLLKSFHEDTPLLFLQNGLAHFEEALTLQQKNIAFGTCQFGAQKENDYTVIHRGIGVLKLAVERGDKDLYSNLTDDTSSIFQIEYVEHAEQMLFEKALLNCFINPMTAILNVNNGYLIEHKATLNILEQMYAELQSAFPVGMNKFQFENVKSLCEKTALNTSSMLADIKNKRPTEVDTILGALINKAELLGKELPTLKTLYYLIRALEEKRV